MTSPSRLVVISNRIADDRPPAGGLVFALHDFLTKRGGIWVGAAADPLDVPSKALRELKRGAYRRFTFDYTAEDHAAFYSGYSNSILWPLCHRRTDLMEFDASFAPGYRAVNARVARQLLDILEPDDVIWVHDYHFLPLAQELRKLRCRNRIGFFLHIPFPGATDLSALSEVQEFAQWLGQYDVVGLQAQRDVRECLSALRSFADAEILSNAKVSVAGREVDVRSFPIGIDVDDMRDTALKHQDRTPVRLEHQEKLIIGVDRLDYSKGLVHKFEGFRTYLDQRGEQDPKATLLQIAPPSRAEVVAYQDIRSQLENVAGATNGTHGELNWTPIRYLCRGFDREVLAGLYRQADVALVTPLIDGMNLVAKEFVASQDPDDPGVLVLSSMTGAAEAMQAALQVNPYDPSDIAEALRIALTMPLADRKARHQELIDIIESSDIAKWSEDFLTALTQPLAWPQRAHRDLVLDDLSAFMAK
ncbi:trehalose-6-phosphate synthase [Gymnodinialimonas sp. 2305UL16-5]|uniref:alpha,alpha-trehalose-phosphate synthase (UDP-forming) n=1 Tax=Gymnodinialimonas mytili TaxID=3126503 RepID=UPI00309DBDF0